LQEGNLCICKGRSAWKAAAINKEFDGEITPLVGSRVHVRDDLELKAKWT